MDKTIKSTLQPEEKILAQTWGKMEMFAFGGAMFPSQGILLATNRRILYFEKTHGEKMEFVREMQCRDVARFFVYRDIFHGIVGLMAKVLHLQPQDGEPIRLVGPMEYKDFAREVKQRMEPKGR